MDSKAHEKTYGVSPDSVVLKRDVHAPAYPDYAHIATSNLLYSYKKNENQLLTNIKPIYEKCAP